MDMGSATMVMATATTGTAEATASAAMSMDIGGECKISMLWNWYTVDSCFLSASWHVTSKGMFAGSCIGVILLVMLLEFLRRASKEYERMILLQAQRKHRYATPNADDVSDGNRKDSATFAAAPCAPKEFSFRPSVVQQLIRALLHMAQFAVAYFIMLLAMYFNGYIIISIIIGAFLGAFVFSWETITLSSDLKEEATFCCG